MTRVIAVSSGKGGVGKTTSVVNISAALAAFNRSVIAVDGNTTTPNLGIHLGIPMFPRSLQDVMERKANIRDAIYHHSEGFRAVTADISFSRARVSEGPDILTSIFRLLGEAEFALIDSAAGLGREVRGPLRAADELLVIVNPEVSSLTDALKLVRLAGEQGCTPIGAVVNKAREGRHSVRKDAIEGFLNLPVIGAVSEHSAVREATESGASVVSYAPKSLPAQQFLAVAAALMGERYRIRVPAAARLFGWLRP